MDPNAAIAIINDRSTDANDLAAAVNDLSDWLVDGGFAPTESIDYEAQLAIASIPDIGPLLGHHATAINEAIESDDRSGFVALGYGVRS